MITMNEIWHSVDVNPNYEVSNMGVVRNAHSQRVLKAADVHGYYVVKLRQGHCSSSQLYYPVHRLVASAFLLNPHCKPCVHHRDGNKKNNKLDNLEWVTFLENSRYHYKGGEGR